ncbi:MAG: autotransporter-associated beta strand repeat-containing protein [Chthoniobacter sp.]|nr:autotransporter-associated beta strand repeat-containing protein [Chthoniobacter sp.]
MKLPDHTSNPPPAIRSHRRRRYCSRICSILATNIAVMLGLHSINAATYYWDTNGATAGSGAATGTWDGSTALWTTDSTGLTTPGVSLTTSLDDLVFSAGTNGTAGTVTVSGAQFANSITFANNVAVTLSGGTSITLGSGGSNSGIFIASGDNAANTISTPVIFDASTSAFAFTNGGAGLLTVGAITGSATTGTQTITISSASSGGITLNGIIGNGSGGGAVALVINNTGSGVTTLSGVNTFTGGTTISGGTVNVVNNLNLGAAANAVTLNGGTLNAINGFTNTHVVTIGANGGTINVNGNAVQQVYFHTASTLTGSGPLTVTNTSGNIGNGVRIDTAQSGYTGNITMQNGGVFEYGIAGAVGSAATFTVNSTGELAVNVGVTLPNTITVANGGTISFENGTTGVFSGSTITLTSGTATIGLRDYYNLTTARGGTISGKLTGAGGILVNAGGGSGGTLTLTGANNYTGATTINNSNVTVSGASGTIGSSSAYALNGSVLTLDNTGGNVDRLKDTAGVAMASGGGLTLTGNATTNTTETVGALAIGTGNSTMTIGSQTSRVTTLAAASLTRSGNATALVRGTSLNQSATSNVSRFTLVDGGASLTQVGTNTLNSGGTADTTQALKIIPYLFGDITTAGNGSNFVTYDATLGLRVLLASEQTTLSAGYTTAANPDNAIAFSGVLSTTSGVALNSLLFNTTTQTLDGSGGSLTVNSGAVASVSTAEVIGSGFSSLVLGNGEGVVTVSSGSALTINTPISVTSSGGLTKAGAGTLTLGAVNTYTGQTIVNQGTLAVTAGVNDVLNGTTGTALQVNNGATFNTNASTQKITTLTLTGNAIVSGTSGVLDLGGPVTYDTSTSPGPGATISVTTLDLNGTQIFNVGKASIDWNPTWTVTNIKELTISSAMVNGSATGGIVKNGAGILLLSGNATGNTFTGATTVNAGTLYLWTNTTATTGGIPASDIIVNSGATLAAQSNIQNGVASIGKSLTLNGANAVFGTNDNPNSAVVRQQRYVFTNALTLASGASIVSINGGTNGGFGSNVEFATLSRSAGATVLFRGQNLGNGTLLANSGGGAQGIRFTTTAPTTQLVGGGGSIGTATTSILPFAIGDNGTYQGSLYLTSGLGTDFVTYGQTTASVQLLTTYASTITSGASALNNVKVTDTSVAGINTATTINSLILNSTSANVGSPGASSVDGTGTLTINSGAILVTTTSAASANGGSNGNYGGLYTNNATIGASGLTLDFATREGIITTAGSSTLTIAGAITGSGGLTKSGAGVLTLGAANSYTGTTTVNAGTLRVTGTGTLGNTSNGLAVQTSGTVDLAGSSQGVGALSGTGGTILNSTTSSASTLTVGNGNATGSYAGVIADNGGTGGTVAFTKTGSGGQTLSGASTYTGATTISAGELIVSGSLNGTAGVSVASTATLASGVTGSIATASSGNVSVGGTLAPGDLGSVGTLTLAPGAGGKLNFLSGATFNFTISGATSDLVSFSTSGDWLSGSGNVALTLTGITAGDYGNTYTVFHNVSTTGFVFSSITGYDTADYLANFTQVGGDYQLSFSAVPEPSMGVSLLGGVGLLLVLRRRGNHSRA